MTNFEKYKNEILEISEIQEVAISKTKNAPEYCGDLSCSDCLLCQEAFCNKKAMFQWLYAEYKEPAPKLTKAERGFCETVPNGYIARDKYGALYVYSNKPEKKQTEWRGACEEDEYFEIQHNAFRFISWGSGEYWNIEELLELEVEK